MLRVAATSSTDILFQLRSASMAPSSHPPERKWLLQKRLDQIEQWVCDGCYLQVTALPLPD
jgi:tyrosine-protein phosphatase YwqE